MGSQILEIKFNMPGLELVCLQRRAAHFRLASLRKLLHPICFSPRMRFKIPVCIPPASLLVGRLTIETTDPFQVGFPPRYANIDRELALSIRKCFAGLRYE